jgi:hypothetical protein
MTAGRNAPRTWSLDHVVRLLTLIALLHLLGTTTSAAATISIEPSFQSVPLGTPVTVNVVATGIPPLIGSFDFDLSWDASILAFTGITFGDSLGDPSSEALTSEFEFDAVLDFAEVSLLAPAALEARQGTGPLTLATLAFDTVGVGTSPLSWSGIANVDLLVSDQLGDLVPSTFVPGAVEVTAVPEPGSLGLLVLGLSALLRGRGRARPRY